LPLPSKAADLAVSAFSIAKSLAEGKKILLQNLEAHARTLNDICVELGKTFHAKFQGFDFSLAPFPNVETSIGKALESLGIQKFGNAGSLAMAAFLASILDEGKWKKQDSMA